MTCRPNDIIVEDKNDFGMELSYKRAWWMKEKALEVLNGIDEDAHI